MVATPRWKRLGMPFLHAEQAHGRLPLINWEALERERNVVRGVAIAWLRSKEEKADVVCYSAMPTRGGPSSARRIFFS